MEEIKNFIEQADTVKKEIKNISYSYLVKVASSFILSGVSIFLSLTDHNLWWIAVVFFVYRCFNSLNEYNIYSANANKLKLILDAAKEVHAIGSDEIRARLYILPNQAMSRINNGLPMSDSMDRLYREILELKEYTKRAF